VKRFGISAALALALIAVSVPAGASATAPPPGPPVQFTHGVASGDVTQSRAVLWTRVDGPRRVTVEVSWNPWFWGWKSFTGKFRTSADRDFTVKIDAKHLWPGLRYWYRFKASPTDSSYSNVTTSEVGTFRTAPWTWKKSDVEFTWDGDSDTSRVAGVNPFNNWEVLDRAREENSDFFVYLGDTIYSDSSFRTGGPADTVQEYRDTYKEGRTYTALTELEKSTSTYPLMDDHEIVNDYDGKTVDPARYAAGRQAFLEYMPIRETGLLHDASCAGDPLYRTVKWGKDVELFITDQRSCRDADVETVCGGDLGPTLPPAQRQAFPFSLFLTPNPPPGCVEAINDPNRTMLGPVQKAKFKHDLANSTAKHKVVISELAWQQWFVLPYDRWEGYGGERSEILNFIRDNGIDNVDFLTTDNHGTLQNEVFIDNYSDNETIAHETITGPIATNTFQQEVLLVAGPVGLFAFNSALDLTGIECRHLDKYSYGILNYDKSAGTATVSSKDQAGAVVHDQNVPTTICTQTYGP
jgi:alkaline phosphatase D